MFKGQIISIFPILFITLFTLGCVNNPETPDRVITIFIDEGRYEELSCGSAVTSHPKSGIRLLCQAGALEFEYNYNYRTTTHALSDWIQPYQTPLTIQFYEAGWSTQLFPSSPDLLTQTNIELGFESIIDSFPIHDGLWHQESRRLIQSFLQFDSNFDSPSSKYQIIVFSDLAFHWSKKTSSRGFELSQGREQSWETIDNAIYELLTSISFSQFSNSFQISIIGVSQKESLGSGLIFSKNQNLLKKVRNLLSLEDISYKFHLGVMPNLIVTSNSLNATKPEFSEPPDTLTISLIEAIQNQIEIANLPPSEATKCFMQKNCPELSDFQKWVRQIITSKDFRRLSILKSAAEGFYLNEALGNPLKMNQKQKKDALYLVKSLSELN